jgi:hypothetical protein
MKNIETHPKRLWGVSTEVKQQSALLRNTRQGSGLPHLLKLFRRISLPEKIQNQAGARLHIIFHNFFLALNQYVVNETVLKDTSIKNAVDEFLRHLHGFGSFFDKMIISKPARGCKGGILPLKREGRYFERIWG